VLRPQAKAKAVSHFVRAPAACLNAARAVAAGYRVSGFVHWHKAGIFRTAAKRLFSVVMQTNSAGRGHAG